MLCVAITASDVESAIVQMHRAGVLADAIELRIDYLGEPSLERIFAHRANVPLIATCRPEKEGGKFKGTERERLALLERADRLGADYVDVEIESVKDFHRGRAKLIVSHHDLTKTPLDLESILRRLRASDADILKLVTMARSITDNVRVLEILRRQDRPVAAFCMGRLGMVSRILAEKFGSVFTFASLDAGKESAPGQVTAREMREVYRVGKIGAETEIYGLIGNPVGHSASPMVHNAAFEAAGIDAVYLPFEVEELGEFIRQFMKLGVRGYSVTVPHKERIIAGLDQADEMARKIGAVNTVYERNGRLMGTNTDSEAAVTPLEEMLGHEEGLRGIRAVVLGAGGAARAIVFGLKAKGAEVTILNRTVGRARRLAEEVGAGWGGLDKLAQLDADVLINATPVGMNPNIHETPVAAEHLRKGMIVFDAVYNPPETRLLREAKARGCTTLGGMEMFIGQAVRQFEIWTGKKAPRKTMEEAAREFLFGGKMRRKNVYLTGYRCTGKSAVGKRLAELMGYRFIDMDDVLEGKAKMPASEVFREKGEEYFRDLESAVLGELSEGEGCVVAAGGGAILRKANVEAMKSSGLVVLLSASPDTIRKRMEADARTAGSRPALIGKDAGEEVEQVLTARKETYEAAADKKLDTDRLSIEEVARQVQRLCSG